MKTLVISAVVTGLGVALGLFIYDKVKTAQKPSA